MTTDSGVNQNYRLPSGSRLHTLEYIQTPASIFRIGSRLQTPECLQIRGSGRNADSRLRRDFNLWSDSSLQTRNDCKLQTTASGVTLDSRLRSNSGLQLRSEYRLRKDSNLQTPERLQPPDSGKTPTYRFRRDSRLWARK